MKNLRIWFKNLLFLPGSYSWALRQMKAGAFVKTDSFNTGHSLFYDYETCSLMVASGYKGDKMTAFVFADECMYRLFLIDDFYVTTLKKFVLIDTVFVKDNKLSWDLCFSLTKKIFKNQD